MYDKRELLCNLWVLRAPWVSGNFTVRLCWTKSTGLPLPNFFLGKEQPSRIDLCWTAKEIREMLSITLFQDFYFYIEYFRPWLHRAFWPHPFPSQCSAHTTVTIISLHLSHSKPQTPKLWYLGLCTRTQLARGKDQSQAGLSCQQPPAISRSTIQYSLHTPCIHFTPFPFLIQNTALLYIQFIKAQSILQHTLLLLSAKLHPSYISSAYFPWAHFNWH